jgi:uncharacterized protein with HEPN domain
MKRDARLYLHDIARSIGRIERYVKGLSFAEFSRDEKTRDAVVRNIEIVGEAVRHLPVELKSGHSHIPWAKMVGMRNKVMHEYFGIDNAILWETVRTDIPALKLLISGVEESL